MANWHCVFHLLVLNLHQVDITAEGTKLKNGVHVDASFRAIICKFNKFKCKLVHSPTNVFLSNLYFV
ncbi:hypothetical protein BAE44_0018747 [Dichanthelium oligosanthes]|uniref:Uncharacterized protein n=1 Tax=Dichanthelium oligosanthes TaxID=888268 RepID=A0A1E5V505_9POAL|nr:hypothetical protein BAE44_0018747 [Dichanthelium oligosanthes]